MSSTEVTSERYTERTCTAMISMPTRGLLLLMRFRSVKKRMKKPRFMPKRVKFRPMISFEPPIRRKTSTWSLRATWKYLMIVRKTRKKGSSFQVQMKVSWMV